MTKDDIIRMAWKTGLVIDGNNSGNDDLVAFANLIAAAEREACAKVCEAGINNATDWDNNFWNQCCENRAAAIRERNQA